MNATIAVPNACGPRAGQPSSWLRRAARALLRLDARFAAERRRRAALRELATMSERDLRDVGLTRHDIDRLAWDAAAWSDRWRRDAIPVDPVFWPR
jgi:uncharacterized protein YjiS (DUF1127 family)